MSEYTSYRGERRPGGALAGIVLAVIIGAVALGVFVHHARSGFAGKLASLITGRQLNVISAPTVVDRIQALNRLETVVYSLDTVVEGDASFPLLPDALTGDKLLLIVHGQTIAGVDLSKLKPEDLQITDNGSARSVQVTLPASEIFVTTLDNAHTRVYQRTTGLFVHADPNLESVARQKAQTQLQEAALQDGILDAARKNARAQLTTLLQGLGFSKVDVK
ncbi:DUF4230 domain-containing protein [Granulicella cerasi]|uniref:DUF4230 domain-containing protein n=1 Tax=Granulicella cerasi TaxID=741063 RepID=A0ABW1Z971_9BACT|nr:DUF4230 domain-containing protein [Granulicella cerasi]